MEAKAGQNYRMIGWYVDFDLEDPWVLEFRGLNNASRASVVLSLQNWLAETPEQKRKASTPGYFSVGMACTSYCSAASVAFLDFWGSPLIPSFVGPSVMAVAVTYLPLFLPPQPGTASTQTEAPPVVPAP